MLMFAYLQLDVSSIEVLDRDVHQLLLLLIMCGRIRWLDGLGRVWFFFTSRFVLSLRRLHFLRGVVFRCKDKRHM